MYIKIKNPDLSGLLIQIILFGFLFALIFSSISFITFTTDIHTVWQQGTALFEDFKQSEGLLAGLALLLCLGALPIFLGFLIYNWFKKRKIWKQPTTITALDFGMDGVSLITRQETLFLPYAETKLTMRVRIITVRTKNGSHPAIARITFHFTQGENTFSVEHKPSSNILYELVDFDSYFKQLSFQFDLSSPENNDQKDLAAFVKEQLENQRIFGMHVRYRSHVTLIAFAVMFLILPFIFLGGMIFQENHPIVWIMDGFCLAMWGGAIAILYGLYKDFRIRRKLKLLKQGK